LFGESHQTNSEQEHISTADWADCGNVLIQYSPDDNNSDFFF
jgi:ABC-type xylose transport system substrate-binding protein